MKKKAQETVNKSEKEFPNTPLEDMVPCSTQPFYTDSTGREDYVVETQAEALALAMKLAGIDPDNPNPDESIEEIRDESGNLTGYQVTRPGQQPGVKKTVAEVHFHPSDLQGHSPQAVGNDYNAQKPHVNYANWRGGKKGKGGKHGHVIFKKQSDAEEGADAP